MNTWHSATFHEDPTDFNEDILPQRLANFLNEHEISEFRMVHSRPDYISIVYKFPVGYMPPVRVEGTL